MKEYTKNEMYCNMNIHETYVCENKIATSQNI